MTTIDTLPSLTHAQLAHVKSIDFCRWVSALYQGNGSPGRAAEIFSDRWPGSFHRDLVTKAATMVYSKAAAAAGTSSDATWAGPLAAVQPLADAFLEFSRPLTILGKIAELRRVPFNVAVASQTGAGTYQWVGENKVKPVTKFAYASVTLGIAKAQGIITVTEELLKLAVPGSEAALRAEMAGGIAQYLDVQFTDPAVAAVANTNPASITNTITPSTASGTSAAALLTDIKLLITTFFTANPSAENAVLIMQPGIAAALAIAANTQTVGPKGGTIFGIPVVTSGSVGARIIMADPSAILFADGGIEIDTSREATIMLDSAPDDPLVATSVMTPLWSSDLVGLRTERFVNWRRARTSAVQFIQTVAYV